jgi:hypothetical protein
MQSKDIAVMARMSATALSRALLETTIELICRELEARRRSLNIIRNPALEEAFLQQCQVEFVDNDTWRGNKKPVEQDVVRFAALSV